VAIAPGRRREEAMSLYVLVLRHGDGLPDEVRYHDRELKVGDSLSVGGREWIVETGEDTAGRLFDQRGAQVSARYICTAKPLAMTVEQAKERLLFLIDQYGGYVGVGIVEADGELAENKDVVSAAARALATEPGIVTSEETNSRAWFPYSFLSRG
jgi:hypothetical protein